MRLVTFEVATPVGPVRRVGALRDGDREVVDLNAGYRWLAGSRGETAPGALADYLLPPDMISLISRREIALPAAAQVLEAVTGRPVTGEGGSVVFDRYEVKLLSPVPRPLSMREFSEYNEHMSRRLAGIQRARRWYEFPAHLYNGNPLSVDGPEEPLIWPDFCDQFDPEPEIGFFVARRGSNLTREEAADCIAGYTLFIDSSARDDHVRGNPAIGSFKGKDFHNIIGPCLVTPDEFDARSGRAWIKVNGELWWDYDIGHERRYDAADLVAFASDSEVVQPGDFFTMGTIGTGAAVDLGRWVRPGDEFEFGVDGLGVLRHTVVRLPGANWVRTGLPGNLPVPDGTAAPGRQSVSSPTGGPIG
jgi:2-keto-4-pentenoate hydratase/2-oxohepta-3-ene-1,7-dioic acid hydratase in catechol pathway